MQYISKGCWIDPLLTYFVIYFAFFIYFVIRVLYFKLNFGMDQQGNMENKNKVKNSGTERCENIDTLYKKNTIF